MSNEDFLKEAQEQNFWEVTVDYEELKAFRDDNEHFFECEILPLHIVQVDMVDMLGEDEYANWAEIENTHNYTDRNTGLPIPPNNFAKLLQREIQDPLWWEAIEKEINGLDEQQERSEEKPRARPSGRGRHRTWPAQQLDFTVRGVKPISEGHPLISLYRGPIQIFVWWGPIQIAENRGGHTRRLLYDTDQIIIVAKFTMQRARPSDRTTSLGYCTVTRYALARTSSIGHYGAAKLKLLHA
jgi:hypothetical protein